jgi:ABC-type cobalamin/Fe3+-siderophores transport system ATPase subunit
MATWLLGSIEITGGFLAGLNIEFPARPGLICIIGPRGSGKSTLAEGIRYGLGGATGANKARQDLVQANLGTAVVTIKTAMDSAGAAYTISRRPRQPALIAASDGRALANVDLERGTFLPLDAFSSLEIESIADESLGDKRRVLLDELQGNEYRDLVHALAGHRRVLEANADAIRNAKQKILDLTERIEETGDVRARLAALPPAPAGEKFDPLSRTSQQQQVNAQEVQKVTSVIQQYVGLSKELYGVTETYLRALAQFNPIPTSENVELLQEAARVIAASIDVTRINVASVIRQVRDAETVLGTISSQLASVHAEQAASHQRLLIANAEVSRGMQVRMSAQQAVASLVERETARDETKKILSALFEERAQLKGTYLLERERVSAARDVTAKKLETEAGKRVRVRVLRNADNLAYRQILLEGLRGARVRNHDDILVALLRLRPEQLAELIEQNDIEEFDAQTSLGEERSKKILEAFRSHLEPLTLEIVEVEDRIGIELNVGTEVEPNFKDASELSRGQKCTALLPLLLARRDTPLLIDQPEDNLDNHFIYETVVETIQRLKNRRQMIFVTHNANIPVLGEADLVIVMDSDGRRGFVSKSGSVDECRSEIVDLLEGGQEAFDLRRRRYEQR